MRGGRGGRGSSRKRNAAAIPQHIHDPSAARARSSHIWVTSLPESGSDMARPQGHAVNKGGCSGAGFGFRAGLGDLHPGADYSDPESWVACIDLP